VSPNLLIAIVSFLLLPEAWCAEQCSPSTGFETIQQAAQSATRAVTATPGTRLSHRNIVSPDDLRRHDTRILAELLVERLHTECDIPRGTPENDSGIDSEAQIMMMVPASAIDSIAKYGFLNQHVTHTTAGLNSQRVRFEVEQDLSMMRLPYSNKARELLPKYAMLNVLRDDFGTVPLPIEQYGRIVFVFKDSVKRRTTWTYDDSLILKKNKMLTAQTTRYKKNETNKCAEYCEAQVWGALDLSDVDHIMVPVGDEISSSLQKLGLPIYRMDPKPKTATGVVKYTRLNQEPFGNAPITATADLTPESDEARRNRMHSASLISWDKKLGSKSPTELISEISAWKKDPDAFDFPYFGIPHELIPLKHGELLTAELATREKSEETVVALKELLASKEPFIREHALSGLSELPWAELKALVLKALKDAAPSVRLTALAIASDHSSEGDVTQAMSLVKKDSEGRITNWLARLGKRRLCD